MNDSAETAGEMLTGADFLASLDDGREVWFDGERVKNVTTHLAFRNYAGNHEQHLLDSLEWAKTRGDAERCHALVDECLGSYDTRGWTASHLVDKET